MTAIIKIDMDNSAFNIDNTAELSRILKAYCDKILKGGDLAVGDTETLLDYNGNKVGYAIIC